MLKVENIGAALMAGFRPGYESEPFWRETPEQNPTAKFDRLGPYYMTFAGKAAYRGPFDGKGIPMIDGPGGCRYDPAAIAQYGLAKYNQAIATEDKGAEAAFLAQADWLVENLQKNEHGVPVWRHLQDFKYRTMLKAPWQSGLSQGQGISLLARAYRRTDQRKYQDCMRSAFKAFLLQTSEGGVVYREPMGNTWIEQYIVVPPSHVLSGCLWALWGVRDYYLTTAASEASDLYSRCVRTLEGALPLYDTGTWSAHELADSSIPMVASQAVHALHIVQLNITHDMTRSPIFREYAARWQRHAELASNRLRSRVQSAIFKLMYY